MKIRLTTSVEKFLSSLDKKEIAKAIHTIELLELFGNDLKLPHSRHLGDGLLELRIKSNREIRIIYIFNHDGVFLLSGFIKKTQKTPRAQIRKAHKIKNQL